ncbi:MAG: hypothetical protein MUD03_11705 [Pirellula sp.]|nr:hypothetical protein [Pirellula sp.]
MICSLCSLLCDQPSLQSSCTLRNQILLKAKPSEGEFLPVLDAPAREMIRTARSVHIAGRFHCVETSRAAIDVARVYRATIDGSHPSSMFEVSQALAGSGAYLCSLAEARSTSDCLIVINSAGLLERFPQLPEILNRCYLNTTEPAIDPSDCCEHSVAPKSPARIVLLGPESQTHVANWQEHFTDVSEHPCSCESIPNLLLEIKKSAESVDDRPSSGEWAGHAWSDCIAKAKYPVVIWGSGTLPVPAIDFWAERLQSWFLQWNEHSRASSLVLSSLANVFHHTSNWLTGYPSRLDFTKGDLRWERREASTARWLEKNRQDEDACLVWIDESALEAPATIGSVQTTDRFRIVELSVSKAKDSYNSLPDAKSSVKSQHIPIGRPGVDYSATLLRSDQIVMSYPDADPILQRDGVIRAASWLRGLLD